MIHVLRAFADNFIFLIVSDRQAVVIDPGDAVPVDRLLEEQGLCLEAVVLTHSHPDHIGGVEFLCKKYGAAVYGYEARKKGRLDFAGSSISLQVIETPGHTLDSLCYYLAPGEICPAGALFTGDTLFLSGCGRIFDGSAAQLYESFQKLKGFPPQTLVYAGHDYSLDNALFCSSILENDAGTAASLAEAQKKGGMPGLLAREFAGSLFFRTEEQLLKQALGIASGEGLAVFTELRRRKDRW